MRIHGFVRRFACHPLFHPDSHPPPPYHAQLTLPPSTTGNRHDENLFVTLLVLPWLSPPSLAGLRAPSICLVLLLMWTIICLSHEKPPHFLTHFHRTPSTHSYLLQLQNLSKWFSSQKLLDLLFF